jgi:hypothetical protein
MGQSYACRWGATMAAGARAQSRSMWFHKVAAATSVVLLTLAALALAAAPVRAEDDPIATFYEDLALEPPTTESVLACHGVGCRYRTEIVLTNADRLRLATMLAPGRTSPTFERRAVATAIAWWDRRIGPVAGTTARVESAGIDETGDPGQMDSVDTSINNTSLFLLLDQLKLLRFHQVEPPVARKQTDEGEALQATAILSELNGGRKWVFDNWAQKYGEMPAVEPLEQWDIERN